MSVYWKRLTTRSIFLFSLIALFCTGTTLQARADKTQGYAWGANYVGQLGNGSNVDKSFAQGIVALKNVTQVALGDSHSLALKSDGTVWAWGNNWTGQLGDGTNIGKNTPVPVSGLAGVVQVACGGFYSLALKSDGTVWTWGANNYGQLGDGTGGYGGSDFDKNTPVQ
ncbi:MAG: RCC1 repeat- and reductase domain-containing protein, partial [Armatimonadetes bacterium]|nr:RCC1 repeat- and reductase domain-containing protein [Armatimonadota bacterium]